MIIRSKNKVSSAFSMSGMTDIVFLLLIFFMLTSTLIAPNALKLLMPQGTQVQTTPQAIPLIELSAEGIILLDGRIIAYENLEPLLVARLNSMSDPAITLVTDRNASLKESVGIMNIAAKHNYKVVLKERI
jgi:biopolymer transport protein ExbD